MFTTYVGKRLENRYRASTDANTNHTKHATHRIVVTVEQHTIQRTALENLRYSVKLKSSWN